MKQLSLEKMEQVEGGWLWYQHLGCALIGSAVGFGLGAGAAYVGCLLITPSGGDLF